MYGAFRLPFLVRSLGPDVVELFGGGRSGAGPVATIEAKAPGGRYRSIASVPVNENGYFRQIVRLKKALSPHLPTSTRRSDANQAADRRPLTAVPVP